jgi:uncharacterized protein YfaS (alpha-2-macroglobulin family)
MFRTRLVLLALFFCALSCGKPDRHPGQTHRGEVFDPAGFGPREAPDVAPLPPLRVTDYGPRGEGTGTRNVGQTRVRFNRAVRPMTSAAEQSADGLLEVRDEEGPVAGHAYFQTPDTLVFETKAALPPAHRYTVSVSPDISTMDGSSLDDALSWNFETDRPTARLLEPADRAEQVDTEAPLFLRTTMPTDAAELRPHVRLEVAGESVRVTLRAATDEEKEGFWLPTPDSLFRVDASAPFPIDSPATVEVSPGWKSKSGPLPADETSTSSFRTHPPLTIRQIGCGAEQCEIRPLQVLFSTPLPVDEKRHIRIRPRPAELSIDAMGQEETSEFWIDGRFLPGVDYRIVVDGDITDVFGQKLGQTRRQAMTFAMPPPELYLTRPRGTVSDDGEARLGISSRHLKRVRVRAARVPPDRYRELHAAHRLRSDQLPPLEALGEVSETTIDIDLRQPTEWGSTALKLEDLVGDWRGAVAIDVRPHEMTDGYEQATPPGDRGIFQFTSLAPHLVTSFSQSVLRVEDVASRRPAADLAAVLHSGSTTRNLGTTDADGLLRIDADATTMLRGDALLTVTADDGEAATVGIGGASRSKWWARPGEYVQGRLVTERGAYQPGERVWVTGWAALRTPHDAYGFTSLPPKTRATVELVDGRGTTLAERTIDVRDGKFWTSLAIPTSARLGAARVKARFVAGDVTAPRSLTEQIRIEEYRVPQFEVSAQLEQDELVGDQRTKLQVNARYYSGGDVSFQDFRVKRSCWQTAPPDGPEGWQLGVPPRHWGYGIGTLGVRPKRQPTGNTTISVGPFGDPDGHTRQCALTAVVQSSSFQEEGATASALVHPGGFYLGVEPSDRRLPVGSDFSIRLAAFDLDGRRTDVDARLNVTVTRVVHEPVWAQRGRRRWISRYEEKSEEWQRCEVTLDSSRAGICELTDLPEGEYRIEARVDGRPAIRTRTSVSVDGGEQASGEETPFVELHAPGETHTPDDPVEVVVQTRADVSGMLLVQRYGIRQVLPFSTRRGRATLAVTPDASWAPTMRLEAHVIDNSGEVPVAARDVADLRVDASPRRLDVAIEAPETAQIRETIPVEVRVSEGEEPIDGRVTVWAVDEAVLGLTGYRVPDVMESFLPRDVPGDLFGFHGFSAFLPIFQPARWDPYHAWGEGVGRGAGGLGMRGTGHGGGGSKSAPRANFETTPLFLGDAAVEDGVARVEFDLPDNLTTFRLIAIASTTLHDETTPMRFGDDDARLRVTAPLIARPALPRFVRPGDSPELGVVVDNQSGKAGTLTVQMVLEGDAVELEDAAQAETRMEIPAAADQHRVAFESRVRSPGAVDVLITTTLKPNDGSGTLEDVVKVPLRSDAEPTIVETVATYGTLDDDAAVGIPVKPPSGARDDYGGVRVTVSSTILGGLRDATRELVNYPYGCIEQTSSRMLPLVALSDLRHFVEATEIPNSATVAEFVEEGIARILSMQQPDGGFSYWPGDGASNAYVSAYATWVLQLAAAAGHAVRSDSMEKALQYLTTVTEEADRDWPDDVLYFHDLRRAIAAHVLARAGRAPTKAIDALYERRDGLPVFANAFVAMALHEVDPEDPRLEELHRELTNAITEHPGTAHVVESPRYDLGAYFHSDLRSSAIAMMALLQLSPDHAAVPKLARGLMQKRYRGAWRNTQENAYALVAMAEYARIYEKETPNFGFRVWTDHAVLLDDRWMGRSSKSRTASLPMAEAASLSGREPSGTVPVNLRRKGAGRAYYRLAMTYAPTATDVEAIARGIDVRRDFRRKGVTSSTTPPGAIDAGEVMAIDVELHTKSLSRYVAIDIPLPAGLEPINMSLGSPKALPMGGVRGWWVSHREFHDDRIVLFADTLHPGTHKHTIYVRATTPGEFVFPPTVAQAMYTPEVFGRTDGGRIVVEN